MMTKETKPTHLPTSALQWSARVLHVLYGLLDSDRDPTDADAETLRYLYSSS